MDVVDAFAIEIVGIRKVVMRSGGRFGVGRCEES
jgi:hypothetical protein